MARPWVFHEFTVNNNSRSPPPFHDDSFAFSVNPIPASTNNFHSLQFVFCFSQHQNNNVTFQAPVDMMFNDFSNVKEQSTEIKDKQKSRLAI